MTRLEELLEKDGKLVYTFKGVSMMPLLREYRDLIVIEKKTGGFNKLDVVLFKRPVCGGDAYVLHRILRINDDGTYWIVGDNCVSGDTVREDQILGVLTSVVRDGKTVPVTAPLYRLYSNTWCRFYPVRISLLRVRSLARRCVRRIVSGKLPIRSKRNRRHEAAGGEDHV